MANKTINSTTQQFLDIFDITNNLVVMKDGTTSLVIAVDAMNFGLLAEEEQDSIMYAYAGLLNSLNYTIQILVRSQTKDVTGYLHLLEDRENESSDRDQQKRIKKYREFVGNLIRERNVLDKKFFVVIPASPIELGIMPVSGVLPGKKTPDITSVDRNLILEKAKNVLEPKRDHLISQFARIGLYSRQLETQEVIQLFYLSYNPEASEGQQIGNSSGYTTPLVIAKIEGNLMNDAQVQDQVETQQTEAPTATPVAVPATPTTTSPAPAIAPTPAPAPGIMKPEAEIPAVEKAPVIPVVAPASIAQTPPVSPVVAPTPNTKNPTTEPAQVIPNAPVVPQETEVVIKHPETPVINSEDSPKDNLEVSPAAKPEANIPAGSEIDVEKAPPLPEI